MDFEHIVAIAGFLILASIIISKVSDKFGIPSLILFLIIGMLAGSDGLGNIYFDDVHAAQSIGVIALIYILFSGGFDTNWKTTRPVIWAGLSLATIGVLSTAILIGIFSILFLQFSPLQGLLLGSIVASTDAAAVFSVLRSTSVVLPKGLKPLAELESGINDPMAIFLTLTLVEALISPQLPLVQFILSFVMQMILGLLLGIIIGWFLIQIIHIIKLENEGLYPVLTFSSVLLAFGLTSIIGGSGFLAVYVLGLVLGNGISQKNTIIRKFHSGIVGLMEIAMFIVLGLFVFPSQLISVIIPGILISVFLILIARPVGVFASLIRSSYTSTDKLILSWLGLKGAVPIVLATFPLLAKVEGANAIFNIVFFVVFTSTLFQGTTIPLIVKFLGVISSRKRAS